MSAIGHLKRVDLSGKLADSFFDSPGNFIMNSVKGSFGFSDGWRAVPTFTFGSYAALKIALEENKVPAETKAIIYDN